MEEVYSVFYKIFKVFGLIDMSKKSKVATFFQMIAYMLIVSHYKCSKKQTVTLGETTFARTLDKSEIVRNYGCNWNLSRIPKTISWFLESMKY